MTARERAQKHVKQSLLIILATAIILVLFSIVVYCVPSSWYRNIEGDMTIPKWQYERNNNVSIIKGVTVGVVIMEAIWFMVRWLDLENEAVKEKREKLKQEIIAELKKK